MLAELTVPDWFWYFLGMYLCAHMWRGVVDMCFIVMENERRRRAERRAADLHRERNLPRLWSGCLPPQDNTESDDDGDD